MSILTEVNIKKSISLNDYKRLTPHLINPIRTIAKELKDLPIIHLNATPVGGGVAEMLLSQVALERSLGLDSRWFVIGDAWHSFFDTTKKIHNLLQGRAGILTDQEKRIYLDTNEEIGEQLLKILQPLPRGIVVMHDPQLMAAIGHVPSNINSILRFHLDLSAPNISTLEFLRPYILKYESVVISNNVYVPPLAFIPRNRIKIIYPAIDPFSEKNRHMHIKVASTILTNLGINSTLPTITQVSRFDPWKDPIGVIQAYYLAKNKIPKLQLVLAGFIVAQDDPEAAGMLAKLLKHAQGDPDIHLFSDPSRLQEVSNDEFINALYMMSTVIIQKSLREGFGLTMTEAMWKGKPVVAGKTAGAMVQIKHGKNGFLVASPEEAAEALVKLLHDKDLRKKIGKAATQSVRKDFMFPRFLLDHLRLYKEKIK